MLVLVLEGVEIVVAVDDDAVVEMVACLQEVGETSSSLLGVQIVVGADLDDVVVVLGDSEMDDKVATYP